MDLLLVRTLLPWGTFSSNALGSFLLGFLTGAFQIAPVSPLALLGGVLFATAPLPALQRMIGFFLLLMVVWRHIRPRQPRRFHVRWFTAIGGGSSFLSALVGSVGPLMAPFFLAYGLVKGAYIGTEALATVLMHATKLVAYRQATVLGWMEVSVGLALAPAMVLGSYVGKRVVGRVPERVFILLVEGVMLVAGMMFLIRG